MNILRAKFKKVLKETEKAILAMTNPVILDSRTVHAAIGPSMKEFTETLK